VAETPFTLRRIHSRVWRFVVSLELELTDDEVAELEAPNTPCADFQRISDDAQLACISAKLGIKPARPDPSAPESQWDGFLPSYCRVRLR